MRNSLFALLLLGVSSGVMANNHALELAKNSGCLACHTVDRKIVGPAWKDVSQRYQGNVEARDALITKIKTGGKGKWIDVTNGAVMPPYSPRVKDQDIAALVDFILSL